MRIAFIPGALQGSSYYRAIVPGLALKRAGHDVIFVDNRNDERMRKVDVIQAQRRVDVQSLATLMAIRQEYKIPFVHDIDDNFNAMPSSNPMTGRFGSGTEANKIGNNFCAHADILTVSTPDLQREYSHIAKRIAILPNAIDDNRFEQYAPKQLNSEFKRPREIRIGWAGSNTHQADLRVALKALKKILAEFPQVKIVFIGDDLRWLFMDKSCGCSANNVTGFRSCAKHATQLEFAGYTVSPYKMRASTDYASERLQSLLYYEKLHTADYDIGIAPIENTTFNRSKSYLKLLEYGMMGIPSVASNFGPYRQYVDEATEQCVTLLASTDTEWYTHLRRLIVDADVRMNIARQNLGYVSSKHLISHKLHEWDYSFQWAMGNLVPA